MDRWEEQADRTCPRCGAPNWPDALRCASCGAFLPQGDDEEIIDVTTGQPRRVDPSEYTRNAPAGWDGSVRVDRNRVFVTSGRGCLLTAIALAILTCCVCWVLWNGFAQINWV